MAEPGPKRGVRVSGGHPAAAAGGERRQHSHLPVGRLGQWQLMLAV